MRRAGCSPTGPRFARTRWASNPPYAPKKSSTVRRPVPVAEPGSVVRHLGALRLRRMTLAGRGLFAVFGRGPPQLHAVVGIVGHLEIHRPIDHVLDRQRPLRAVAAGIG